MTGAFTLCAAYKAWAVKRGYADYLKHIQFNKMSKILELIDAGIEAYHKEVLAMSDRELYLHCYKGGDFMETDFCSQELKKRGIEQFRDCHACQGCGCTVCNGFGELPTFE